MQVYIREQQVACASARDLIIPGPLSTDSVVSGLSSSPSVDFEASRRPMHDEPLAGGCDPESTSKPSLKAKGVLHGRGCETGP